MIDAAKLTERLEESKRLLLETYPWATIQDSRIIWDNYAPVMQVELMHPDLKMSVDWDSRRPGVTEVCREDHETWLALTEGKFLGVV
jgi:hypothetical protein